MKLVFRTFIFHILCIIVFAIIYLNLSEGFHFIETNNKTMIDFLLLSTSIQSGVGFSNIYTLSYNSKIVVIIQQMLMLFTHIITLYILTI